MRVLTFSAFAVCSVGIAFAQEDPCASIGGCAREPGFCVHADNHDINDNVEKNPNVDLTEDECLSWCKASLTATPSVPSSAPLRSGCEMNCGLAMSRCPRKHDLVFSTLALPNRMVVCGAY
jgi:hypothetical protein